MAAQPQQLLSNFVYRFNELPAPRKMGLAAALAASIALIVGLFLWSSTPEYKVLFSNLSEKDAGTITTTLQQMNAPYKTEAGGTLLVPADQVYDLRFKLAAQGLPKGGAVGFELMDSPKLGMTQFQEQIAFQRGMEGELARTVQSLAPVESARVHLAIPKPSVFIRDKQMPSASVLVTLHPGRALDPGQVQSIVHLVSSSVPELSPNNVTVVDQTGKLLTSKTDSQSVQGLNASQLDYIRQLERNYAQSIEAIVSPIVGEGNVKAEVRADLDFSESEATSESYKPNPTPDAQAIRSQQSVDDINGAGNQAQGVPGALTNQPPGPATAPLNAPPGANAGANVGSGQAQGGNSSRKESTTNFELDKTIRHTKEPLGRVKRLSVAVVVNYKAGSKDAAGVTAKPTPLAAAELTQINNLVRESMGFNPQRGDTVNVVNAAFTESKVELDIPLWKDPDNVSMVKSLLKNLLIFGLAFYLVFGVLRPILRDMVKPHPPKEPRGGEAGAGHSVGEHGGGGVAAHTVANNYAEILAVVREFIKNNPKITADIVKEWMVKESDEGLNESAILMLTLDPDEAAEVFKYLGPKEVQKLGTAMASVGNVSRENIEAVLRGFHDESEGRISLADSDEYIRSVLKKALGDDKAAHLIDRILQGNESAGIESLKWLDSASVAEMVRNEHPQIIATIMVHLERDHASEILNLLTERLRNDVMVRIATLEGAQPMAMRELNEVLTQLLSGGEVTKKTSLGGVKTAADILNFMGGAVEASVLANIREHDADLAQKIQDSMFTFDNILGLDDRSIQLLLREVQSETLIVALKGTSQELRDLIFKNMSSRAAEALKEDLEAKGAVRLSEVEAEQKEILKIVRKLVDEGQIVLGGKGGDEALVG